MSEPLYKASHHIKLNATDGRYRQTFLYLRSWISSLNRTLPLGAQYSPIREVTKVLRAELYDHARAQLADKADHLLNVYVEWNQLAVEVTATYVFNNRDTALMFKLSLN